MKKWMLKRNKVNTVKMAEALGVREPIACVLANRGIGTYDEGIRFLESDLKYLHKSEQLKDLEKGIQIIGESIKNNKKIAIYGDYDVDGVMSTVILYKTLKKCGGDVIYYIPHRQREGYGMNMEAVAELSRSGIDIILTCDNGISAINEIKKANELGMKVVVLDHHEPLFDDSNLNTKSDILPEADAIIDPKRKDCDYPFKMLCAGGLAYKFAVKLYEYMKINCNNQNELLMLAAIATVCDIVELIDENRIIVKNGLKYISGTENVGLRALLIETEISDKEISEYHIGFILGPCINATGRLESAKTSIRLFIEEDIQKAEILAKELVELNASRKQMTMEATTQVIEQIENGPLKNDNVLVIFQENVHESIAGIVAGRVKEKYHKPVIVITKAEEMAKGSARSIEGYNIFEELYKCKDLFAKFGGHPMAAGLSLVYENIDKLRIRLNESCKLTENEMMQVIKIEKQLSISKVDLELAYEIKELAPFGKSNPDPLFGCKNVLVERIGFIGKNKNIIKFTFFNNETSTRIAGISFDGYDNFIFLTKQLYGNEICDRISIDGISNIEMDLVYSLDINDYRDKKSLQLMVKDFRYSKVE